jgi:hypothetical protein
MNACLLLAALAIGAPAAAQVPQFKTNADLLKQLQSASAQGADPLAGAFFPPELVMKNQQVIGLSADQRAAIVRAVQETQPRFIEAQWQLEAETAALAELVRGERVDEPRVLQQIDRVLDLERQIKRSQIELLVRIKNQLTSEQQQRLARLGRGANLFGSFELAPAFRLAPGMQLSPGLQLAPRFQLTPGFQTAPRSGLFSRYFKVRPVGGTDQ